MTLCDSLGWPLLTDVEREFFRLHGYEVQTSLIGHQIARKRGRCRSWRKAHLCLECLRAGLLR